MAEKRAAQRIPVNLRAYYRSRDTSIEGWVADLSRLGLFLRSEFFDDLGSEAVIDLDLPGNVEPLRLRGEVVRVDSRPTSCGMGIRFASIPAEARRPLANFMIERSYQTLR
jgi:hypothetical protein